jgi:hypothetical protein
MPSPDFLSHVISTVTRVDGFEDHLMRDESEHGVLRISCDECVMQGSDVCADCVVTFLCTREPDDAVLVDVAEVRALRLLERGGLAPALRHRPRHTGT